MDITFAPDVRCLYCLSYLPCKVQPPKPTAGWPIASRTPRSSDFTVVFYVLPQSLVEPVKVPPIWFALEEIVFFFFFFLLFCFFWVSFCYQDWRKMQNCIVKMALNARVMMYNDYNTACVKNGQCFCLSFGFVFITTKPWSMVFDGLQNRRKV